MKNYLPLLLGICLLFDLSAQSSLNFEAFKFRSVGPLRGGRVTAVAGVAKQPNVYYLGSTGGGLWKTEDYGMTWKNSSDGYFTTPSIGAISVAPQDSNLLYVGTGSDGLRSNVIVGKGMYKTTNGGDSWTSIGLEKVGQIGAVEVDPQDKNRVFVAAIGQPFQANSERGIYRTTDGGANWEKVLFISDTTGFVDVAFMPGKANVLYAAAWRAERKPWTIISGGEENGIYKSMDGGKNWTKTGSGLPKLMGKIDLAVSPADPKIVYALIEAPKGEGGLYRSEDEGQSYQLVSDRKELAVRPFYFNNITIDPNNVEVVYFMGIRFSRSVDGGKTWKDISTPHADHHGLWINPADSDLMIEANDGGANVSHNGGKTWSHQFNQSTAEIYQVEVDEQYPYWLYGGQQDNYSAIAVPSLPPRSHQAGSIGWIEDVGGCETGPAVPHPNNSDIVYANCKGRFSVYNKATGQEQYYLVGLQYLYGHNPKDLNFRFQRVAPIHISPHDPSVIYHASQYLHKTTDEGKTWKIISPDLTAFETDKQVISGAPITRDITGEEFYSTIYSIRESALEKGVIWVGANDGPIHVSRDGGEHWKKVTPKGLAKGGRVDAVEASIHQKGKAYATILRNQLGDWRPYIYRTENYGKSWRLLSNGKNGIPADYPVRVVREDPEKEGLLYAGTEFGLFISFNDGLSWLPFQQNLPITPITDIKIHRNDLVLSTMGRGFWILDDLGALQQGLAKTKKAKLFRPDDTYRYRYSRIRGGRSLTPALKYPRPSVLIDYYLPDSQEVLQLQILDEKGIVVRQYQSADKKKKQEEERFDMATNQERIQKSTSLTRGAGHHRFRWDMKHHGAWTKEKGKRYQNGPMVSPGKYRVKLIIGKTSLEQEFQLLADPRVLEAGVEEKELQQQEQLTLQLVALLSAARKKLQGVEKKLEQLKEGEMSEKQRLSKLRDQLRRKKGNYTQPMLIDQIAYLYDYITGADQLPGKDAYERYEVLKKELAALGD